MAPSLLLLLLLLLLISSSSLPAPRRTFLLNSADRPLLHFSPPDVHNTSTLLLSEDTSTLYVGAGDALLSLDVSQTDVIRLKKKVEWRPSDSQINECKYKVRNPTVDCPNLVSVLQPINSTHLYACGSHAFSPHDAFIHTESFSLVEHGDGKARLRCPHSPFRRSTAITHDGELFTATTTDFKGAKPQISRHFSKDGRPDVCQESSASLLQDPEFISSSLDLSERKLYFFFSEVGKEFRFIDELQIARVAQVCKDDVGGLRTLQKKWTSFAKASLICQSPKQLPFNVLQDVFTLPPPEGKNASETLFYGVFTSQWSSGPESAVCAFKLQDIRDVFSGSYLTLNTQTMTWAPRQERRILGQCGLETASDQDLGDVRKSFLTGEGVKPVKNTPLVVSPDQRYSRVVAERVKVVNGKEYTVLFLLTESGFLHKVVLFDGGEQLVEEIQIFTEPQLVKSMVLSSAKGVLYVGTSEGVTAVPVARCSIYSTCSQCILARDPQCGWSRSSRVCKSPTDPHQDIAQDVDHANVSDECQGQTRTITVKEVFVELNEAVRLSCQKPSNLASLTWTSFKDLPQNLFIQPADGSLRFLASPHTFGAYRCEAVDGGYREVVASYDVRQMVSPRSLNVIKSDCQDQDPLTEDPTKTMTRPSGDPETPTMMVHHDFKTDSDHEDKSTVQTSFTDHGSGFTDHGPSSRNRGSSANTTPGRDPQSDALIVKSYHSELVVVSLLMTVFFCALVLGGLHMWRQSKSRKMNPLVSPDDGSKTNQSMESVPSLSSPEDTSPELKVVQ